MTDPNPNVAMGGGATTVLEEPLGLDPDARRRTYWEMVWRVFRGRTIHWIASGWVLLLLLTAVIVPFIANSAPFTAVIDGRREWPLFRDMSRIDWILIVCTLAAILYGFIYRRIGRREAEIESIRAARIQFLLPIVGVTVLVSAGILFLKTDFLDVRDYHNLERTGKLEGAVFPPLHWGYKDQESLELNRTFEFPSRDHILGTDGIGRDALARLLWGTRIVLAIGLISELIAVTIGVIYGAMMGYFVGKVDLIGMRFVEMVEAIPTLFLLITFVALYGRNISMLMVIIGLTSWTGIARFVRAEFLRIRRLDYVTAAKATGLPLSHILFRHMLPNGLTPVIVSFTFGVAGAITSESILSFLGIGVEPPTPSWGVMLLEAGNPAETFRWWLAIAPGMMIFLTVFAYNIIGEGMRDAIDPQLNKTQ